jgi:HD-GYP domain-containing protein (c-di-GMP phosphodiesterase class II)
MKFCLNHFLSAISFALDYVEHDVFGVELNHGKRVAYNAGLIGRKLGFNQDDLFDLIALAILHDNGLGEFMSQKKIQPGLTNYEIIKGHCIVGEHNIKKYPLIKDEKNIILYHHEKLNGTGFFHITGNDIPLKAQIIGFADYIDTHFNVAKLYGAYKDEAVAHIMKIRGEEYSAEICDGFFSIIQPVSYRLDQGNKNIDDCVQKSLPPRVINLSYAEIREITEVLSNIIDAKSKFTERHSRGLAEKVDIMAKFYAYSDEQRTKLVIAADLHDLGKLLIPNTILEANRALNEDEIAQIQSHTYYTRKVLSQIDGFQDITEWAANHHEKLNGTGYPYGKTARELDFNSRLMGCLDIYQALTEDRPYRKGMNHSKAIKIMSDMAANRLIESVIVADVNKIFLNS